MKKIAWANTEKMEEANIVILGIPDESGSLADRKGTSTAPAVIRECSQLRDIYHRDHNKHLAYASGYGIGKKIFDAGDIPKRDIRSFFSWLESAKLPVTIGGDHSITTDIIKTLGERIPSISMVYFDAHPDFISSKRNYYGSVFADILSFIDIDHSIQIGTRMVEGEEIDNINKHGLECYSPVEILEFGGITKIKDIINEKTENRKTYISIDMDCIDPAYAPGVSTPIPMGLRPDELAYLLISLIQTGNVVGIDIVETCPPYDEQMKTSHLVSRLIGEICSVN